MSTVVLPSFYCGTATVLYHTGTLSPMVYFKITIVLPYDTIIVLCCRHSTVLWGNTLKNVMVLPWICEFDYLFSEYHSITICTIISTILLPQYFFFTWYFNECCKIIMVHVQKVGPCSKNIYHSIFGTFYGTWYINFSISKYDSTIIIVLWYSHSTGALRKKKVL